MNKSHTVVWVTPVPRIASQGRDKQVYTFIDPKTQQLITTKAMNQTRASGAQARYTFLPDYNIRKYITGLEELISNPFKGLDSQEVMNSYNLDTTWIPVLEKILSQDKITKQRYYEILHSAKPDAYDNTLDIENSIFNYHPGKATTKPASLIASFNVILYDGPNRFTDETPRQTLAIQLFKNHAKIAKSKAEINPAVHDFYISEENEAEMETMRKQDIVDEAIAKKVELLRSSNSFKPYQVACLCTNESGNPILKGEANQDLVKQTLNKYLGDSKNQMNNIEKFNNLLDLVNTKETRPKFEILYMVQQAKNAGLISQSNGMTWWLSQRDTSRFKWDREEKLVSFLVTEYLQYLPEEQQQDNCYGILLSELANKNVRLS